MNTSRTADEIEADIERVRGQVDATLDALERRLSVRELLREGIDYLRYTDAAQYVARAGVKAGRAARDHPVPAALGGAGLLAVMVLGRMAKSRIFDDRGVGRMGTGSSARDKLRGAREAIASSAGRARERLREAASGAQEATRSAGRQLRRAGSSTRSVVHEHPVATGAIGLALVAIAAAAIRYGTRWGR